MKEESGLYVTDLDTVGRTLVLLRSDSGFSFLRPLSFCLYTFLQLGNHYNDLISWLGPLRDGDFNTDIMYSLGKINPQDNDHRRVQGN